MRTILAGITLHWMGSPKTRRVYVQTFWVLLTAILFLLPARSSAAVTITISPTATNLPANGSQQFTATVTGASDTSVTWTVREGLSGGTISNAGLYSAPAVLGTYHVVATSNAESTQSATATVTMSGFIQDCFTQVRARPHFFPTARSYIQGASQPDFLLTLSPDPTTLRSTTQ